MTGLLVFMGIPLLFALMALQSPFFQNWRFFVALSASVYFALWTGSLHRAVLPLLTGEFSPWAPVIAIGGAAFLCCSVLLKIASDLSSHGGGGYHLPGKKNLLVPVTGFLSGYVVSGLAAYLLCISPLHETVARDKAFADRAVDRVLVFTRVIDRMTFQRIPASSRRSCLMARIKTPPPAASASENSSAAEKTTENKGK
ncbi:MAG: hypothetical protein IJU70_13625 [Lentisphaeria bacterium]|nr:hypothetical protein [Lentisphaeria bacterium]